MNPQRSCLTKDVAPESILGRQQPRAYACLDSARGWTAADITRTGGREDGAGPLLAAALDRSSGVGCVRDHIAADLVTVADAPREGLRSKPLSLRIVGEGRQQGRSSRREDADASAAPD
jgi:hypothetical protein